MLGACALPQCPFSTTPFHCPRSLNTFVEWKVTFKDPGAAAKTKENLCMFFTVPGNFVAANFTGK